MINENPDSSDLQSLLDAARNAARNSYSPYSGFKVGSALRLSNGAVITGTNVENVSYGLTICAERAALVRAVAEHGPGVHITAIAVANLSGASSPPCGACRQMLAEFSDADADVIFPGPCGAQRTRFVELFPYAFDTRTK
jgi:cytidine deaminase